MILSKEVTTKWSSSNKQRLIDKGYKFTKVGDEVTIKVNDLSNTSKVVINVQCDYCFEKYTMVWDKYFVRVLNNSFCNKIACKKCNNLKTKEVILNKYGVENASHIEDAKIKRVNTFLKNYGVENPSKDKNVKLKKANTTLKNYGVDNPFKHKGIIESMKIKKAKTLYETNNQSCSKQQKHISKLYEGVLNFNVDNVNLDISFLEEKIYVEYDGSGHDLSVVLSNITRDEFDRKELRRYYMLEKKGWKMMRIISKKDFLPTDSKLIEMLKIGKTILEKHSWVKFDIDNNLIESSLLTGEFDYGKLKQLPKIKNKGHLKSL
jgi:very-short-patch-repair endonuclease